MDKFAVTVVGMADVPKVNAMGKFDTVTRVTIRIGDYGSFTKDFPAGENTPEIINAWKATKANEVRAVVGV